MTSSMTLKGRRRRMMCLAKTCRSVSQGSRDSTCELRVLLMLRCAAHLHTCVECALRVCVWLFARLSLRKTVSLKQNAVVRVWAAPVSKGPKTLPWRLLGLLARPHPSTLAFQRCHELYCSFRRPTAGPQHDSVRCRSRTLFPEPTSFGGASWIASTTSS